MWTVKKRKKEEFPCNSYLTMTVDSNNWLK